MRSLIAGILLLLSCTANADYFGVSYGRSVLNYDLRGDAYEWLLTDGSEYNSAINILGGNIDVETVHKNSMSKIFYGHRFTENIGVELFYLKIEPYSVRANIDLNVDIGGGSTTAYGNASGEYVGSVDLKGFGFKLFGEYPITDSISVMGGLGVLQGKTTMRTNSSYNVDYGYNVSTPYGGVNEHITKSENESSSETLKVWVPVWSGALLYYVSDDFAIRTEYERYGHPVDKLSIDVWSIGLQYEY